MCSLAYYFLGVLLLGVTHESFLIALVIYLATMITALSPFAEKMLRLLHGIRKIETNEERDYLMPIFTEVMNTIPQEKVKGKKPKEIELYIIDKLDVNAYALGNSTIAVTKGAMKAFDEEQLKGIIAHEVAHIRNYDTVANMFLLVASGYFYLFVLLFQFIIMATDKTALAVKNKSANYFGAVIKTIFKVFVFVFSFLVQITLAIERRKREYRADKLAYEWGFGEELISALYLLEKINLGDYRDLKQKLTASHPRTTARIGRLEDLQREEGEE
jgi:heat shock protein HtpX